MGEDENIEQVKKLFTEATTFARTLTGTNSGTDPGRLAYVVDETITQLSALRTGLIITELRKTITQLEGIAGLIVGGTGDGNLTLLGAVNKEGEHRAEPRWSAVLGTETLTEQEFQVWDRVEKLVTLLPESGHDLTETIGNDRWILPVRSFVEF